MPDRLFFPATGRNRQPIWEVLSRNLPASGRVLEVASGSGEHAVYFASQAPGLTWTPSDPDPTHRRSIQAHRDHSGLANVDAPLDLDVCGPWPALPPLQAVLAINLLHISAWEVCLSLFRGAAAALAPGGLVYLYGAYRRGGKHTAPSNEEFDRSLRERNPRWGVRDLEAVEETARGFGFLAPEVVEMPVNNLSLTFRLPT